MVIKSVVAVLAVAALAAAAAAPQQLNTTAYAGCLGMPSSAPPQLASVAQEWKLSEFDGLLVYLAVYSGWRFPVLNETVQQPAYERWSVAVEPKTAQLAQFTAELATAGAPVTPGQLFWRARSICDNDVFCAALLCHDVLRTLGRPTTTTDHHGVNYAPKWYQQNTPHWEKVASKLQKLMISLRRDGGGDRWGGWYHSFGMVTYALHEAALYGPRGVNMARFVAVMNEAVTPFLFHGKPEDPVKSRIDKDSVAMVRAWLTGRANSMSKAACEGTAAYVL
eukprot:PLAT13788.1.p1 GENE.PLAT13788.1~~PLAT13788.1.p1  ORF type:complete len:279 (+),score=110.21 PLAT13788.1:31-867(+)